MTPQPPSSLCRLFQEQAAFARTYRRELEHEQEDCCEHDSSQDAGACACKRERVFFSILAVVLDCAGHRPVPGRLLWDGALEVWRPVGAGTMPTLPPGRVDHYGPVRLEPPSLCANIRVRKSAVAKISTDVVEPVASPRVAESARHFEFALR